MGKAIIKPTKTALAKVLGVSRQSLYYEPKREKIDLEIKSQIESVLTQNPAYGHKRIALELKLNRKRILRIMKKYNIKPYRRRSIRMVKKDDIGKADSGIPNLIKDQYPIKPNVIWVSDFTYIKYKDRFIYVATIMDLFTREIVGVGISRFHNRLLVLEALEDALNKYTPPLIIHSDQGSEYRSEEYLNFLKLNNIQVSMSKKKSPWENGHKESYYSNFKLDLADVNRFNDLSELIEEIYLTIYYYNNNRIHTKLKTSPVKFKLNYLDSLSNKWGT